MRQPTVGEGLEANQHSIMALPGVVGVGQGERDGSPCIQVLVAESTPELLGGIPPEIEGYPVAVVESGEFRALNPG